MTKQVKAELMLLLVVAFWGISYYLLDLSLRELQPFTLNAIRFGGAFLVAGALAFPRLHSVNRTTLKYSFWVGFALFLVYIGATFGVMYTSLSNAGFLCALAVVFTPVFGYFFKGTIPDKNLVGVVIACVVGIGLLTLSENMTPAIGDLLCIMCSVAYAGHLLITETAVSKPAVDAFQLGVFQLGFAGLMHLALALIIETPRLPQSPTVWGSTLFLTIFCTGLAFILQAIAQQHTSASHVGVIFTLEPVIAGVVAFFLAGEILLPRAYVGAAILVGSLLVMEVDPRGLRRRKHRRKTPE